MTAPVFGEVVGVVSVTEELVGTGRDRRARVARTIRRLGITLSNAVKRDKLTGQVLNVRSGRLRRSINERFEDEGNEVSSTVGTPVTYGRFWELGFVGVVSVRAFIRRVKSRNIMASGTVRGRRRRGIRTDIGEGIGFVRSHQRRITEPARPFLQPALEEMRDEAVQAITDAAAGGGASGG